MGETYESSGVDIAAGEEAVQRIKDKVRSTFRPEVIGDIGGFGGLFSFANHRYRHPVLVSSTDGVGTKALVAQAAGRFDTIGVDLVAMCVDDLVCQGAEPLFFLDYIAVGKLDPDHIEQLVEGVAEGCRQAGCALIGGEMAEHPGAMEPGEFDLVGFAVGVAERDQLITGEHVGPGDVLIGLPSPGSAPTATRSPVACCSRWPSRPSTDPAFDGAHHTLAEELLVPSVIYAPAVLALLRQVDVRAVAHVTGGGLAGNLTRVLPKGVDARSIRLLGGAPHLRRDPPRSARSTEAEMRKVFNLGVGMVVVVAADEAYRAIDVLRTNGHRATQIGTVTRGDGAVRFL
jgi:phosphoribosylformylglycinamidine cyclo-ligase